MMRIYQIIGKIFRFFVYAFLLLPLIVVILTAFSNTDYVVFPPVGFTFKWFDKALQNSAFIRSVGVSFRIAVCSTFISTVIGTVVSLYFWKMKGTIKQISEALFLSPVVVPTVVTAVAFLQFFAAYRVVTAFWELVIAYSIIQIAYVIRTVSASLYGLDARFEEASLVLGASPLRTLFKVTLPNAKRGIIAGAIFAFVVAFDEAVIVMFISNARTITYPLRLYSYISEHFDPMISAFSALFIIFSFIIITVVERKIGLSKMY